MTTEQSEPVEPLVAQKDIEDYKKSIIMTRDLESKKHIQEWLREEGLRLEKVLIERNITQHLTLEDGDDDGPRPETREDLDWLMVKDTNEIRTLLVHKGATISSPRTFAEKRNDNYAQISLHIGSQSDPIYYQLISSEFIPHDLSHLWGRGYQGLVLDNIIRPCPF